MKPASNNFHVMRSTDTGETTAQPWVPKNLAEKLAAVLNEIEEDRVARLHGKNADAARESGVGDFYYVKEAEHRVAK